MPIPNQWRRDPLVRCPRDPATGGIEHGGMHLDVHELTVITAGDYCRATLRAGHAAPTTESLHLHSAPIRSRGAADLAIVDSDFRLSGTVKPTIQMLTTGLLAGVTTAE